MQKDNKWYQRLGTAVVWIAILGLALPCFGSGFHYVDNQATGANDGSSWKNAWPSIEAIEWDLVQPGDTLFISGGKQSRVYDETLVVGQSGTAEKPLFITKGREEGHKGKVVINGNLSKSRLVVLQGRVSDLLLQNPGPRGRGVYVDESRSITIERVRVTNSRRAGIFIEESAHCLVRKNTIMTVDDLEEQSDGIYSQRNAHILYEGNTIIIDNGSEYGHNDGLQSYLDSDLIIRNNHIVQRNQKRVNAQGIFCSHAAGTLRIYNNVVYAPNTFNSLIFLRVPSPCYQAHVVSNTLLGSKWGSIRVEGDPEAVIQNNIAWNYNGGTPLMYEGDTSGVKNNLFYQDPKLDQDFMPLPTSPAIDSGVLLPPSYALDKRGVLRPIGNGFDRGAFEVSWP